MADLSNYQPNTLKPQNFQMVFAKLPNVVFHCRQVPLPNISMGGINLGSRGDVDINVPNSKIDFAPFTLMFVVDEDLKNYTEVLEWFLEMHTEDFDFEKHTSDASIITNTNNNNANKELVYEGCWPRDLSEITLNTSDESEELLCTVVFEYEKLTPR